MDPQKQPSDRSLSVPQRDTAGSMQPSDRDTAIQTDFPETAKRTDSSETATRTNSSETATRIMREQIDRLYESQAAQNVSPAKKRAEPLYHQTHSENADHQASQQHNEAHREQWNHYHTQWQKYYQQYYERYYLSQLEKKQRKLETHAGGGQPAVTKASPVMVTAGEPEQGPLSRTQAVSEIRNELLGRVKEQSKKVRGSKHFVPIAAALIVALTFVFLQYNSLIFAQVRAYVSPGSISPANLVVDPTTDIKVGPEPKVVIPKINVDAPVIYDVPSIREEVVQEKLKGGVVHYPIPGANAMPGQKGNSVILGHSSNDVFDDGAYKFVFVQLNNLEKGDTFYLHYQGTRYTYSVIEKKIIDPTQVGQLVINDGRPLATLVTCDPPGTALKRLIVIGEQISPNPNQATDAAQGGDDSSEAAIPGNSPTLFQRLFGQ